MTQSNPLQTTEKSPSDVQFQRKFWGVVAISVLAFFAYAYSLSNLFKLEPTMAVYIKMAVYVIAMGLAVTSFILAIRRRVDLALTTIFYYLLIAQVANPATTQGRTLYATFTMLVVGTLMIGWLLPRSARRRNAAFLAGAFILAWVFEWIDPPWRVDTGATGAVGPIVAVIFTIILVVLLVRQTWGRSMRNKLLVAFIGVTLVATIGMGVPVALETTRFLEDNLERELTTLAIDRATRIGDLFNEQINTLTTLTLDDVLQESVEEQNRSYEGDAAAIQAVLDERDARWRAADAADNNRDRLVRENLTNEVAKDVTEYQDAFPGNIEVFVTDVYGGMAGTTNRTSDYYQADEGWWQAAYANGEGAIYIGQPEYDESAGAVGVNIALPIRNRETGEIIGILRTTYVLSALETILADSIGETGSLDMFVPGENVIHVHEGGLEETVPGLFEQLQEVYGQGMVELVYEGELSVVTQAPVQTLEGNPYVDNLGWVVAFSQHRDEAFEQVNGQIQGVIFIVLIVVALAAAAAYFLALFLVRPIIKLTATAEEVAAGDLNSRAEVTTSDEVGTLATAFNTMTSRLQETLGGLEQRVAERTQNLELAAEVGRSVSQVRDLEVMLQDACELIQKEFDLYYTQVYLTDPSQTNLVLEAGTGEVGAQLRARGHSLRLNTGSINGRAAMEKRTVVISDTAQSASFQPNPLLPDTRGEMAVPLVVGENVVGVLDMQTTVPGKLNEEVLPAFEALAGQLAVAVQNANLVAEAEEARAEVEAQARRLVREGWDEHLDAIHKPEQFGFVFDRDEVTPLEDAEESQLPEDGQAVSAPISLTGEMLGSLVVEIDEERQNEQTSELVNTVARQVAQQLENLRLLESSERFRFEAEQASRRQTREGWQQYMKSRAEKGLGYLYDQNEVRPHSNGKDDPETLTLPLKASDETVGKLSIKGLNPDDRESFDLANAVAERLGAVIENLRLSEQTKQSLALTDELYSISQTVNEADSEAKLLEALAKPAIEAGAMSANLMYIDVDAEGNPEWTTIVADWRSEGDAPIPVGTRFYLPDLPFSKLWMADPENPQLISDVNTDERLDEATRAAMQQGGSRAIALIPLTRGQDRVGLVTLNWNQPHKFDQHEKETYAAIIGLASPAVHGRRLFEQAQKQAERETMLNTINQKIQSATSVEAVLQIAARELGHALGAPMTIAQLSMKDQE